MKQFLAIYMGSEKSKNIQKWEALDEKTRNDREKQGMIAWMAWGKKNHKSIVVMGSPLGSTQLVNANGVSDTTNLMTGYTVIQAESHEEASKLFLNHPHFAIFPGDSVEIMECLPLPAGMN